MGVTLGYFRLLPLQQKKLYRGFIISVHVTDVWTSR